MNAPAPELKVGPALVPDFQTGAMVLAILAWPTAAETEMFRRVSNELMAEVLRQTIRTDPDAVDDLHRDWPQQDWDALLLTAAKRRMAIGSLGKRLNQRMVAAKMAIGMTHKEIFGQPAKLPFSLTGLSIDQLARLVRPETTIDNSENIEKFIWRRSLPIIHLAMAFQLLLAASGTTLQAVPCDTQDIDFFRRAVLLATALESMVGAHPTLNVTHDQLTHVVWRE